MIRWPIRVVIPWDLALTGSNSLRKRNVRSRWGVQRGARVRAFLAWKDAGAPRVAEKVRLTIIVRREAPLDPFNVLEAVKPLVDGVCVGDVRRLGVWENGRRVLREFREAGMLPDDSARWLEPGGVVQETGPEWAGNRAEVEFVFEQAGVKPCQTG